MRTTRITIVLVLLLASAGLASPGCTPAQVEQLRTTAAAQQEAAAEARDLASAVEGAAAEVADGSTTVEDALGRLGLPEERRAEILEDVEAGEPAGDALLEAAARYAGEADAYLEAYETTAARLAEVETSADVVPIVSDGVVGLVSLLAPQYAVPAGIVATIVAGLVGRKTGRVAERRDVTEPIVRSVEDAKLPGESGEIRLDAERLAALQDAAGIRPVVAAARASAGKPKA